jgi:hypothetical protein
MRWRLLKLDLPYLLGELLIVILGVVIALSADRWNNREKSLLLKEIIFKGFL